MRFEKHVFVCVNERSPEDPRGCCKLKGSEEILKTMKEEIKKRGLNKKIRINKSGCLDQCAKGVSVVVYPEGVWYGRVTKEDIKDIIESHLLANQPVTRLRTDL